MQDAMIDSSISKANTGNMDDGINFISKLIQYLLKWSFPFETVLILRNMQQFSIIEGRIVLNVHDMALWKVNISIIINRIIRCQDHKFLNLHLVSANSILDVTIMPIEAFFKCSNVVAEMTSLSMAQTCEYYQVIFCVEKEKKKFSMNADVHCTQDKKKQ